MEMGLTRRSCIKKPESRVQKPDIKVGNWLFPLEIEIIINNKSLLASGFLNLDSQIYETQLRKFRNL
jgi:hypothetical protein